jgi:hypothetical protein
MVATGLAGTSPAAITDVTGLTAALTAAARASDHALGGWSFDPALVQAGSVLATAGLSYVARVRVMSATISNVLLHLTAAGVTLTAGQCFCTVHTDAGVLLGAGAVTADQQANWQSGGLKVMPLTTPQAWNPGDYCRVRYWFNGTTGPTLSRAVSSASAIVNAGLTSPAFRYSTADTGLTTAALAPTTLGTQTGGAVAHWVGIS